MKSRSVPVRSGRRREDRRERGREGCERYIDTEVDAEKEKVRGGNTSHANRFPPGSPH